MFTVIGYLLNTFYKCVPHFSIVDPCNVNAVKMWEISLETRVPYKYA